MSFPIITEDIQKQFETTNSNTSDNTPLICGTYGRACRQMGDKADRVLCMNCPLKTFAEERGSQNV